MKRVVLNPRQVAEVVQADVPVCGSREVLVAVAASLISTGTETAGYDAGGRSPVGCAIPPSSAESWTAWSRRASMRPGGR